jgi:hypothetical protein
MKMRLVSWSLGCFLVMAACDGSGEGGGGAETLDSFLSSYTDAVCASIAPCCGAKGFDSSGATCRALLGSTDKSKLDAAAYNPEKGKQCLAEVRAASASVNCDKDLGVDSEAIPSCKEAVPIKGGGKALGDTCEDDDECVSVAGAEVDCARDSIYKDGSFQEFTYCRAERVGKEGEGPCTKTIDGSSYSSSGGSEEKITDGFTCDVAQGLYCPTVGEKCARYLADGESCQSSSGGSSGQCLKNSSCKEGVCAPKPKAGEPCQSSYGDCAEGFTCDTATKACKAKLAEGAACKSNDDCLGSCTNGACKGSGGSGLEDLGYAFVCGPKKG